MGGDPVGEDERDSEQTKSKHVSWSAFMLARLNRMNSRKYREGDQSDVKLPAITLDFNEKLKLAILVLCLIFGGVHVSLLAWVRFGEEGYDLDGKVAPLPVIIVPGNYGIKTETLLKNGLSISYQEVQMYAGGVLTGTRRFEDFAISDRHSYSQDLALADGNSSKAFGDFLRKFGLQCDEVIYSCGTAGSIDEPLSQNMDSCCGEFHEIVHPKFGRCFKLKKDPDSKLETVEFSVNAGSVINLSPDISVNIDDLNDVVVLYSVKKEKKIRKDRDLISECFSTCIPAWWTIGKAKSDTDLASSCSTNEIDRLRKKQCYQEIALSNIEDGGWKYFITGILSSPGKKGRVPTMKLIPSTPIMEENPRKTIIEFTALIGGVIGLWLCVFELNVWLVKIMQRRHPQIVPK